MLLLLAHGSPKFHLIHLLLSTMAACLSNAAIQSCKVSQCCEVSAVICRSRCAAAKERILVVGITGLWCTAATGKKTFTCSSDAAICFGKTAAVKKGATGYHSYPVLINATVEEDIRHLVILHVLDLGRPLPGGTRRC